jgi:flagellar biosynthesis/type III secretory pathway protein FliH
VPQLRDFLSRFRPAGAPGAAARAAVPLDRARELAAEVVPVLTLLDGTQAECEQIVGRARRDADAIIAAARAKAAATIADGDQRASATREEAARQVAAAAAAAAAAMVADAEQEAARIRARAGQRIPALVGAALREIRQLAAADLTAGE